MGQPGELGGRFEVGHVARLMAGLDSIASLFHFLGESSG